MYENNDKVVSVFAQVHLRSEMGAMLLDHDGRIVSLNESGRDILGCSVEPVGIPFFDAGIISPQEIERLRDGRKLHREAILDFSALRKAGLPTAFNGYRWIMCDMVSVSDPQAESENVLLAMHFINIGSPELLKEKFGNLWHSAQITFWEYDPSNDTVLCPGPARELFGLPKGNQPIALARALGAIHPDDRQRVAEEMKTDLQKQRTEHTLHCRAVAANGLVMDVMICYTNVFNRSGDLVCRHGLLQDISGRKAVNDQLRRSEKRYRDLFNSIKNAVALHEIILDAKGKPCDYIFLDANPAFEALTGLKPDEIIGRTVREVLPATEEFWIETYGRVALSGESVEFENHSAEIGRYYHVYAFSPERHRFATIFSDVTERKLMEQAIIDNEEIFRNLFRNIPDATFLIDMEADRFIRVNEAAKKQYGYSEQEFMAMRPVDVSDEPQRTIQALAEAVGHIPRRRHKRKDGSVFDAEISMTGFEVNDRRMVVATVHDLTRSDLLADQLIQAQKMEALGRLSGGVAHDFNNLLQVILGFGQMLLADKPDQAQGELVGEILNAARRGKSLADRMLAFSRQDFSMTFTTVDIIALLLDFKKVLAGVIGDHIRFKWNLNKDIPHVRGDAVQIEQVVMNLCINARDAMAEGGELTISADLESTELPMGDTGRMGTFVRVSVSDTGIGMSELVRSKVFEPFFTTKEVGEGTGLGLASSYTIIERHGGYMSVDSTPGCGSDFHFWLPVAADQPDITVTEQEDRPTVHRSGLAGLRLLLAEDDSLVRNFVVRVLENEGIEVTHVSNGEGVIEQLQEGDENFDVVMMDVVMPGMNGIRTAEKLREFGCRLPILFASGYSKSHIEEHLGRYVLRKPFGVQELLDTVREIISDKTRVGND